MQLVEVPPPGQPPKVVATAKTEALDKGQVARFTGVAAAYHVVSYAGIVTGVEPSHAYEHADGLSGYLALLDEAARAS